MGKKGGRCGVLAIFASGSSCFILCGNEDVRYLGFCDGNEVCDRNGPGDEVCGYGEVLGWALSAGEELLKGFAKVYTKRATPMNIIHNRISSLFCSILCFTNQPHVLSSVKSWRVQGFMIDSSFHDL